MRCAIQPVVQDADEGSQEDAGEHVMAPDPVRLVEDSHAEQQRGSIPIGESRRDARDGDDLPAKTAVQSHRKDSVDAQHRVFKGGHGRSE